MGTLACWGLRQAPGELSRGRRPRTCEGPGDAGLATARPSGSFCAGCALDTPPSPRSVLPRIGGASGSGSTPRPCQPGLLLTRGPASARQPLLWTPQRPLERARGREPALPCATSVPRLCRDCGTALPRFLRTTKACLALSVGLARQGWDGPAAGPRPISGIPGAVVTPRRASGCHLSVLQGAALPAPPAETEAAARCTLPTCWRKDAS